VIILRLALASLRNRLATVALSVLAIAVSVTLLLGVEKIRTGARDSFANTISGTDLVVGSRSGAVQLLLYAVFRIGNATNNISWQSYQEIAARPEVAWIVPLSLGDSHRGFRVLGTSRDYFERYRYRRDHELAFAAGGPFEDLSMRSSAPTWRRRWATGWGIRSWWPMAWAARPSPSTTTSRFGSRASWPRPARRWTAPSISGWRRSRPFMSAGKAARSCRARRYRRTRCGRWI
jgi:hypothetical protein